MKEGEKKERKKRNTTSALFLRPSLDSSSLACARYFICSGAILLPRTPVHSSALLLIF